MLIVFYMRRAFLEPRTIPSLTVQPEPSNTKKNRPMPKNITLKAIASISLRVALATSFLSAVADRFGLWGAPGSPNVAWGSFDSFLEYTSELLWFLPNQLVPVSGWIATVLEVALALGLLIGWRIRWAACSSALLLLSFATTMTISSGVEPAFSYSVWTASASALLLASIQEPPQAT